ncbi:hypothetical protein GCK72_021986 [Caenorhabditis remanei]|uniref:Uncharacterized protein n=1 Tax=Caenorhabditis remanei TaxID=31234 RepID=A0A6A5GJF8_CAERE|nr:hypothetical protein GCK72_021986 [Caenorhabditis remanei]KAF1755417.1 hypothetical protein GCK72_021986 [Caenorhabditis remanei]
MKRKAVQNFGRIINTDENGTSLGDHPTKPFLGTAHLFEEGYVNLFGCSVNPFVEEFDDQLGVAVGGPNIHIYRMPVLEPKLELAAAGELDEEEDLYTVAWCYDKGENLHKIATGGVSGVVYIVDAASMEVQRQLLGAGNAINDIKTCPTDSEIIAAASADRTIRIYHIKEPTCLILIGGRFSHHDSIVSIDWVSNAEKLYSCGFDHKVMCWDLNSRRVKAHIADCCRIIRSGQPLGDILEYSHSSGIQGVNQLFDLEGHTMLIKKPENSINDVHFDCVDSLRVVDYKEKAYVISKSTGHGRKICFWRIGTFGQETEMVHRDEISTSHTKIAEMSIDDGYPWFGKIDVDVTGKWLAAPGDSGNIHLYNLKNRNERKAFLDLKVPDMKDTMIRQVMFSPNGRLLFVVGDAGFVARIDRVPDNATNVVDVW